MKRIPAVLVHIFTASGIVWCFLSIDALMRNDLYESLLWLLLAYFIDMIDGSLARFFQVKLVLPNFDGGLLDNIIDYTSYVLIPALFLYKAELLPQQLALPLVALMCLVSTYQFCQSDAKTEDNYFTGFPSYWNVMLFYFILLKTGQTFNMIIMIVLLILVFVPIKYIYPSRTKEFRKLNIIATALWSVSIICLLWQMPDINLTVLYISLLYIPYYFGISIFLTLQRK